MTTTTSTRQRAFVSVYTKDSVSMFESRSLDVLHFCFQMLRASSDSFSNQTISGAFLKLLFIPPTTPALGYLMMFAGTISVPFILTPTLCIEENDPVRSAIVSTIIFVSGIITLLQCTLGVRWVFLPHYFVCPSKAEC